VVDMTLKQYNMIQGIIFKRYNVQCHIVNDIISFNILCSKIAEQRDYELTYTSIKKIIAEVKDFCKKGDGIL
jgi:hypothetical protein